MSSFNKRTVASDRAHLLAWYQKNQRDLPWRADRNPYRIWLSEVMLQQTTVKAVIPYYENFLRRFPDVDALAEASLEEIYELWAGLGYYSRARSLHRSAQALALKEAFPTHHQELLELPGFGDYTARAVASLAFGEPVGVVDGNVIRVLSRRWNRHWQWWKSKERAEIQSLADAYAANESALVNQGLMELGATICTPKSPTCFLCPWQKSCAAYRADTVGELPLKKPKRETEIWQWQAVLVRRGEKIALVRNDYAPFLRGQWILPGRAKRLLSAPKRFDFKHGITHHNIFVTLASEKSNFIENREGDILWVAPKQLKQKVPFALIQKAVALSPDDRNA